MGVIFKLKFQDRLKKLNLEDWEKFTLHTPNNTNYLTNKHNKGSCSMEATVSTVYI